MTEQTSERKEAFVKVLAKFLVGNQAGKSIMLGMTTMVSELAREWAELRSATPLHGYPTVEEAESVLKEWLLG